jgi:hypothetical protein
MDYIYHFCKLEIVFIEIWQRSSKKDVRDAYINRAGTNYMVPTLLHTLHRFNTKHYRNTTPSSTPYNF